MSSLDKKMRIENLLNNIDNLSEKEIYTLYKDLLKNIIEDEKRQTMENAKKEIKISKKKGK